MKISCKDAYMYTSGSIFGSISAYGTYRDNDGHERSFNMYVWESGIDYLYLTQGADENFDVLGYAHQTDAIEPRSMLPQTGFSHLDMSAINIARDTRGVRLQNFRQSNTPACMQFGQKTAIFWTPRAIKLRTDQYYYEEYSGYYRIYNARWTRESSSRIRVEWEYIIDVQIPKILHGDKGGELVLHIDGYNGSFAGTGGAYFTRKIARSPWPSNYRDQITGSIQHFIHVQRENVFDPVNFAARQQISLDDHFAEALKSSTRMNTTSVNWLENGRDIISFLLGKSTKRFTQSAAKVTCQSTKEGISILRGVTSKYVGRHASRLVRGLQDDLSTCRRRLSYLESHSSNPSFYSSHLDEYHLLLNAESQLVKDIAFIKSSDVYLKGSAISMDFLKSISSCWLQYRYLLLTTASDIDEIDHFYNTSYKEMSNLLRPQQPFDERVSSQSSLIINNYDIKHLFSAYLSYGKQLSFNEDYEKLCKSGFFPTLSNMWDLVPYSFIVDWFTDIGDCLANVDSYLLYQNSRIEWQFGFSTLSYSYPVELEIMGTVYKAVMKAYDRKLLVYCPSFGGWSPQLSDNPATWIKRSTDGAALTICHK